MIRFAKAQITSLTASSVDYGITFLATEVLLADYVYGSALGTVCGGAVNFFMARQWVFQSTEVERRVQLAMFFVAWLGYLGLMTGGVYLFTEHLGFNYMISKLVLSLVLAFCYNYPVQKSIVFARPKTIGYGSKTSS